MTASRRFPHRWAIVFLLVMTCVVVWKDVERYLDPVGEKTVLVMTPGAGDFVVPFLGARSLLLGVNPYGNEIPELQDPFLEVRNMLAYNHGRITTNFYPPSLLVFHVPFALVTSDWREAGRIMFNLNVGLLFLLAWVSWWLLARIGELAPTEWMSSLILVPLLFFLLAANGESSFALERGQSDILGAALCWGALVALLNRWILVVSFLATAALLAKGYALLFTIGLILLILTVGKWREALIGIAAAAVLLLWPVMEHVPVGMRLVMLRSEMFHPVWYNHSFANVFWNISPRLMTAGRWGMMLISGCCALTCWWYLRLALVRGTLAHTALWGVAFATCSLATMIGGANTSLSYNLIYLMPGMLVLFIMIELFAELCGLRPRARAAMAFLALVSGICLFVLESSAESFTLPGIGVVLLVLTLGTSLLGGMYDSWLRNKMGSPGPSTMPVP